MKSFHLFLLSLLVSVPAFAAGPYEYITVPHSEIDQYLVPGSDATGTPANLQGLWWLDGNPLPDEVISLASIKWEAVTQNGEVTGYAGSIPVYDQKIWSWHQSAAGEFIYSLALKMKLNYNLKFNKDFTYGEITPQFNPLGVFGAVNVPSSLVVDFTITKVADGEFRRDSTLFGQKSSYRFRRIVDGNGNRLPAFDEMLKNVETPNALLPVCTIESNELPSPCAD